MLYNIIKTRSLAKLRLTKVHTDRYVHRHLLPIERDTKIANKKTRHLCHYRVPLILVITSCALPSIIYLSG